MLTPPEPLGKCDFVRQVEAGLSRDPRRWRRIARIRIRDLHEDLVDFGSISLADQHELAQLETLVGDSIDAVDVWAAIMVLALVVLTLIAAGWRQ